MMKILIQGRKNGYSVLYPSLTPSDPFYSYANDIQSISASNNSIYYGKLFYTLAFTNGGYIFTKYIIGDDVERGQLGEIGISVFISNTEILKGDEIKSLLDELINIYHSNFIFNHKIVEPKNGFDWTLFETRVKSYNSKLLQNPHNFNYQTSGTKDPAFHYYKSDNELIELFDKPFQEEYFDYKQIYIIEYNHQGASNPLNVLKNSGVEVNPDLSNEYRYLNSFSLPGLTIKTKFNNQWNERTSEAGKNIIRSKWPVKLSYQKDEKCYKPIESPEKTTTELSEFLEIRGNRIIVKTDRFNKPEEIQTVVEFNVVDHKKNEITNVQIDLKCNNYRLPKTVINNKAEFKGPELIQLWTAEVRTGEYSGKEEFTPETDRKVEIKVKKHITITLNIKDEYGNPLSDFEVKTNLTKKFQKTATLNFIDEKIDIPCQVIVRTKGYEDWLEPSFTPSEKDNIVINLKKKEKKPQGAFLTKLKTIFSNPAAIAISIVSVLLIAFGIWLFNDYLSKSDKPHDTVLTAQQIQTYIEGDSFLLYTLDDYKQKWDSQQESFIKRKGKGFFGGEEEVDSSGWKKEWQPVYNSIEKAIKNRILINDKNFAELKNQTYSSAQNSFKTAIQIIDINKYDDAKQKLGDVSKLTISEIAVKVDEYLKSLDLENEPQVEVKPTKENGSKPSDVKNGGKTNPGKTNTTENPPRKEDSSGNKHEEIIGYLKGSELNKNKLEEYKGVDGINKSLKNSIQLGMDFWLLDGSGEGSDAKTYFSYREKVKKDDNFNNSKLRIFLDKMCQQSSRVSYSEIDKRKGLK